MVTSMTDLTTWGPRLEALIHRDLSGRGLLDPPIPPALLGGLNAAAEALLAIPAGLRPIDIVTGFNVPDVNPTRPETDGPPGAVQLAEALAALDHEVTIVSDAETCALLDGLTEVPLLAAPRGAEGEDWCAARLRVEPAALIAVERVSPSHDGPCRSMRGIGMDDISAPLHLLFEGAPSDCVTIGIGDGGNELGMGNLPVPLLAARVPLGARIAARVGCQHLIAAAVSNWGAAALGALLLKARGRPVREMLGRARGLLEAIVARGAIDGISRRAELCVDGLPWSTHEATLEALAATLSEG